MIIAIEGQRLFRKKKHGMDFVALELIKNLMRFDHINNYLVFVAPGEDVCLQSTNNVKIITLKAPTYPLWEQVALPLAVKKYKCDLLHCTSNTAPIFSPVPVVLTLHDIIFLEKNNKENGQATAYQQFGNIYRRLVVPIIFKKSAKVLTVSKHEESIIRKHFKLKEEDSKLKYIYNGVGLHFHHRHEQGYLEKIKQKYGLPNRFIFHLGNPDPKKNTYGVIKAFSEYIKESGDNIVLVMPDFDRKRLLNILNRINHIGLLKQIKLTGYIQNTDLPGIYLLCQLFLYPSLRESFGIPILEAMKCGSPIITSNTSCMPEIAGDASIQVSPHETGQISAAIKMLLKNKPLRNELKEKGFIQAENFSWSKMAFQTQKVYEAVLA